MFFEPVLLPALAALLRMPLASSHGGKSASRPSGARGTAALLRACFGGILAIKRL